MAFPTIPNTTNGRIVVNTQANTTATRTFPAFSGLTFSAGDLLVAVIGAYQSSVTNTAFSGWSSGFTEIQDASSSTTSAIGVAWKVATGSESGSLTVTQAATITGHAGMILFSVPGAEVAGGAPAVSTSATGSNSNSDPDTLSPSWGAADTLWCAVSMVGETSTSGAWQANIGGPSGWSDYLETGQSGDVVGAVGVAVAFLQSNTGTLDPPTFNTDTSNARWRALTIAIRPTLDQVFTDQAGPGDTATSVGDFNRAASDALGLTDAVNVQQLWDISLTDQLVPADALALELGKGYADQVTPTDSSQQQTGGGDESFTDQLPLTDLETVAFPTRWVYTPTVRVGG